MRARLAALILALAGPAMFAHETVIDLWPEGVPGLRADDGPEKVADDKVSNVNRPTLTVYAPQGAGCGTAVIVCPGGAYLRLSMVNEGSTPAHWLNGLGATAFVLKYRLVEYGQPAPLRDVLRAVRLVRSRAAEFGVRPDRIGVMGYSAGGHLAACSATLFEDPDGRTGAPLDAVSGRPDFIELIYPVITMKDPFVHAASRKALLGTEPAPGLIDRYSVESRVLKESPPAFLVSTEEDKSVPAENSILFYQALRKAGVPAELHLYARGPHGFGMRAGLGTTSEWPKRCEEWMRAGGWLPPASAPPSPSPR